MGQNEKWMNEPLHCVRMNMCTDEHVYVRTGARMNASLGVVRHSYPILDIYA